MAKKFTEPLMKVIQNIMTKMQYWTKENNEMHF